MDILNCFNGMRFDDIAETQVFFRRTDYIRIMDSDYKSLYATKIRRKEKKRSENKQTDAFLRDEGYLILIWTFPLRSKQFKTEEKITLIYFRAMHFSKTRT